VSRPDADLSREVIQRANGRCEYCRFPQAVAELPFHIDHIIAEKHGGATEGPNLAWACFSCNMHKGPNIAGIDPNSRQLTRLFHPRVDRWEDHFRWQGAELIGLTEVGRTTIAVLNMNDPDGIAVRQALAMEMP
jgi:hypothetical protein